IAMGGGNKAPTSVQVQRKAFIHNPKSRKTAHILSLPNEGLCYTCHQTIEWRKRYRKYKPLTVAAKCCSCGEKNVKRAYHQLCDECAEEQQVCAKCVKPNEIINERTDKKVEQAEQKKLHEALKLMTESERRTFYRELEKNDPEFQKDDEDYDDDDDEVDDVTDSIKKDEDEDEEEEEEEEEDEDEEEEEEDNEVDQEEDDEDIEQVVPQLIIKKKIQQQQQQKKNQTPKR
ncbi:hypothetical protein SAMD00019534_109620, partial [Acytostelium subglobosum LB1]|uniref:hypothetical protein n=1 Tax=Acytostelium subglobosum LB1 TaxID=1410327 RepID=UPI000644F596